MGNNKTVSETAKKSSGLRFLTWLMIVVIAITTIVDLFCVYNVFGKGVAATANASGLSDEQIKLRDTVENEKKAANEIKAKGAATYIAAGASGVADIVVADKDGVYEVLESCAADLGISNARDEYRVANVVSSGFCDVYTAQQIFDGYDVYGKNVKVIADKTGGLVGVTGTHYPMPENYQPDFNIDSYDAEEYAEKHIKSREKASPDDYNIRSYKNMIYIDSSNEPQMSYVYGVTDNTSSTVLYDVIVSAADGEVLAEETEVSAQNQDFYTGRFGYRDNNYLYDDERNIYFFDSYDDSDGFQPANGMSVAGQKMLAEAQKAADFFDELYDRRLENYYVTLNSASAHQRTFLNSSAEECEYTHRYEDNNGDGLPDEASSALIAKNTDPNVISREYARAIMPYDIADDSVINAGLADLFAELIEDYSDGGFDGSCDWKIYSVEGTGHRNIKDPKASANAVTVSDAAAEGSDCTRDEMLHDSTIISHSAYLMTIEENGHEALTTEQLSYLYYYSMLSLPAGAGYEQFRDVVTGTAIAMNKAYYADSSDVPASCRLNDSQLSRVIEVFDECGIESAGVNRIFDKKYTGDCEFHVYDCEYEAYEEYHVTVTRVSDGKSFMDEDISSSSFKLPNIEAGIYNIVVRDRKNDKLFYALNNVLIGGSGSGDYISSADITTKFGAEDREIALVLDVSGSMYGTPMQETKNAAVKFVDYVLAENPSIRISLIPYSSSAYKSVISSSDRAELVKAIQQLRADGGTNIYSAIDTGAEVIKDSKSDKKLIFLMSDGYPEDGPKGKDGTLESAILEKADEIKDNGNIICSLGFFHSLSGTRLKDAQNLMKSIASSGYSYNIKSSDDLAFAFNDLADSVGGNYSVVVRIACPVDVTVKCGGEYLCSAADQLNTRASFGSLSFEGENDEVKVLRLNNDSNYELCINGTGEGEMDYTISFADSDGEYSDVRTFEDIPISRDTVIATNTKSSGRTTLNVDSDGDGKFDEKYSAGKNGTGRNTGKIALIIISITLGVLILAFAVFEIVMACRNSKYNKICHKCGSAVDENSKFCIVCGEAVVKKPLFVLPHADKDRPKQTPTAITAKLVVMGICCLVMLSVVTIYRSAATTVYKQLRDQELVSAEMLYNNSVDDTEVQKKYLSMLTKRYLKQVDSKYDSGDITEDQVKQIYDTVYQMDMGDASDEAEEKLKELGVVPKRIPKKKKTESTEPATGKSGKNSSIFDDEDDDYEDYYDDDDDNYGFSFDEEDLEEFGNYLGW